MYIIEPEYEEQLLKKWLIIHRPRKDKCSLGELSM